MFAEFVRETKPIGTSTFDSHFTRKSGAEEVHEDDEPHRLLFLIAISKGRVGAKEVHERDEPHRGSAFDSPGLASIASYPGLIR